MQWFLLGCPHSCLLHVFSQKHCLYVSTAMPADRGGSESHQDVGGQSDSRSTTVQSRAWTSILDVFDVLLTDLRNNNVPKLVVQAMFKQLFSFVDVQLFNQLLLTRKCCTLQNAEHLRSGLAQVSCRDEPQQEMADHRSSSTHCTVSTSSAIRIPAALHASSQLHGIVRTTA